MAELVLVKRAKLRWEAIYYGTSRKKTMNRIFISELSDAACETLSGGGLEISVKNAASEDTIDISTSGNPPRKVYEGGPLEYTAEFFPGTSGNGNRNAVFDLPR